ncbi:MAG: type IV secretion system DNA-binding domain-containing protein, partial [Cyanobacteria bacterium J06636_16]
MTLFLLLLTAVMGYATIRVAMRDRPKNQSDFYSKRKDEPYETTDDDHLTLKGYYVGVASGTATTILTFLLALGLWRSLNFENATNAFITLVFCGVCVFFAWGYITLFRERFVAQEMATHQKATAEKDKQESDERYEREFKERQEARNAAEAAARVPRVPEDVRNEHMMVVAGTGHGKTQLLQSMLVNDLQKNAPIIVIDSQEGMLERLLHVVPEDRLMYLDGSTSLALSPFEIGDTGDDARVTMALDLFEN